MPDLDRVDRLLLNYLQGGFPLASRPYLEVGERLGIAEEEVIARVQRLLESGALNRFGPVLSTAALGGARALAAMQVPPDRLDKVARLVSSFPAVSHNYERTHRFNLWFVVSSEDPQEVRHILSAVEQQTGLTVMELPAIEEYGVEVKFHFNVND